jgi:ATP-dependent Clp protease adaptor protein ClpS
VGPQSLAITHFGVVEPVVEHLALVRDRLAAWATLARELDGAAFEAHIRSEIDEAADPQTAAAQARRCRPGSSGWASTATGASEPRVEAPPDLQPEDRPVAALPRPGTLAPMTETIELPRTGEPGTGLGGQWRVIVRNDDHNTFDHVARTLATFIPGVSLDRGYAIADRIHNTGQAIVWSGDREAAELYWEQLNGAGLTMAPLERG